MFPLLLPLLADTVVDIYEPDIVHVHEWGVVQFQEAPVSLWGAPWGQLDQDGFLRDYEPVVVEAPVIWFHGPEFTGSFSVEVAEASITTVLPVPDIDQVEKRDYPMVPGLRRDVHRVAWTDLSFTADPPPLEEVPPPDPAGYLDPFYDIPFAYAMPFWREVPSLCISRASDGWTDCFLYYECTVNSYFNPVRDASIPLRGLLFTADEQEVRVDMVELFEDEVRILRERLSEDQLLGVFCDWGNNEFKTEEIAALWNTWQPFVMTCCLQQGEKVFVQHLSGEIVETISHISLEVDQGHDVVYSRLFLGLDLL